ncbi:MAG: hypothetical protein GW817_10885 [Flavobacteriales bacterium]|nr:hypothetical protein [Flavobacteriales bacterium]NCP52755.1 hypothetical protein [Flavobacteriales bacterium]NCQ13851.1 hypothetical protein [Flavobacteriales bacterium]
MKTKLILIIFTIFSVVTIYSQNVIFNDPKFKSFVVNWSGADTNNNGEISVTEAANLTGTLDVAGANITDLTGIEHFTSISGLDVSFNKLSNNSTFDISHNSALTFLDCSNNVLTELNVSTNPNLITLYCDSNNISTINLNFNTVLEYLSIKNNNLSKLSISNLTTLKELYCNNNNISALNLIGMSALSILDCSFNNIPSVPFNQLPILEDLNCSNNNINTLSIPTQLLNLDCSNNNISTLNISVQLRTLNCSYNNISSLNTNFSPNITTLICNNNTITNLSLHSTSNKLTNLNCSYNNLTTLNLTKQLNLSSLDCSQNQIEVLALQFCPNLFEIYCENNSLKYLDITNGNNENLAFLNTTGNNQLLCIMVDDYAYANGKVTNGLAHWVIDIISDFGEDCYIYIPDDNFEQALIDQTLDSGTLNDYVDTDNINLLETLDISNQGIFDLTGIKKFESLISLDCSQNLLTTADFSKNTNLQYLYCSDNQLTNLGLATNSSLKELECQKNQISSLDLNNNAALTSVACNENEIVSLFINNCSSLGVLNCSDNQLNALNINNNIGLIGLDCSSNQLNALSTIFNTSLIILIATENQISSLNLVNNTALLDLQLSNNLFSNLNLSTNTSLIRLLCDYNNLSALNLTTNLDLLRLNCFNNNLSNIDLSNNVALTDLDLGYNNLSNLNLSNNPDLTTIYCDGNSLNTLNLANGNNTNLTTLYIDQNPSLACVSVDNQVIANDWNTEVNLPATFFKDAHTSFSTNCNSGIIAQIKAYLQGPYGAGIMLDGLRTTGNIPTTSPYIDGMTCNASVFTVTGSDAIIDWVWMELRDSADGITVITSMSALLQADGDVVANDGVSPLNISVPEGAYYIMLSHRNHLGIRTANTINLVGGTQSIDLTTNSALIEGGSNAIANMGDGNFALFSGDFDGNGQVQNSDKVAVEILRGTNGFSNADLDMNSEVQNTDIQNKLSPNIGKGEQFTSKQLKLYAKRKNGKN